MIVNAQHGSTSSLQRRFKIGYSRAGRIMDMLEEKGIVGAQNGSKPREVLVDAFELEQIKALEGFEPGPIAPSVNVEEALDTTDEDIEDGVLIENSTDDKKSFDSEQLEEEDIE